MTIHPSTPTLKLWCSISHRSFHFHSIQHQEQPNPPSATSERSTTPAFTHTFSTWDGGSVTHSLLHPLLSGLLQRCPVWLPTEAPSRLQYVQNSAARVLTHTKQSITPLLQQLHWLPVKSRITYRILLLTHKSLHGVSPPYLTDLLHPHTQSGSLRSSDQDLRATPPHSMADLWGRGILPHYGTADRSTSARLHSSHV